MDCRRCDWYLCASCRPQQPSKLLDFWRYLNWPCTADVSTVDLPEVGVGEVAAMATSEASLGSSAPAPPQRPALSAKAEAEKGWEARPLVPSARLVADFCESFHGAHVEPTTEELDGLWKRLCVLHPGLVAGAVCEQLAGCGEGAARWQARLRALYVLEHIHSKGSAGADIAALVANRSGDRIKVLANVELCRAKALEVMRLVLQDASSTGCLQTLWQSGDLEAGGGEDARRQAALFQPSLVPPDRQHSEPATTLSMPMVQYPAPRGRSVSEGWPATANGPLKGAWRHKDNPRVLEVIEGDVVIGPHGTITQLTLSPCGERISVVLSGKTFSGQLVDGELVWDDGDVWVRSGAAGPLREAPEKRATHSLWDEAPEEPDEAAQL